MINIRKATIKDVKSIVDINIKTWKSTYSGIINHEFLLDRENKKLNTINIITNAIQNNELYLCAEYKNEIIGFARYGRCKNINNLGEIYALYIIDKFQQQGVGKKFIQYIANEMISCQYKNLFIWVLTDNPNINFYLKLGGKPIFKRINTFGKQFLNETGFLFNLEEIKCI